MSSTTADRTAITGIILISGLAFGFLVWILYFKPQPEEAAGDSLAMLPALNALFNAISASFATGGFFAIRARKVKLHVSCMLGAVVCSALFFISYVIYHNVHGDTPFGGEGFVRAVYFFILVSHIAVTIFALPLILTTLFFAATKRFATHKRVAKFTLPLWLYVSATGVAIFLFLRAFG